jgi:hypothetical protein
MPSGQKVIYSRLVNGQTGTLCGSTASEPRIAPLQQFITSSNRTPYVVYFRNQTIPNHTKNTTSVIDEEVYIIQCYALTYDGCVELAEAVRADLDRAPVGIYAGVTLNGSFFRNQTDPEFDDKTELFDCEIEIALRISRAGTLSMN